MPVTVICAYEPCSKPFPVKPSLVRKGTAKYCSNKCRGNAKRKYATEEERLEARRKIVAAYRKRNPGPSRAAAKRYRLRNLKSCRAKDKRYRDSHGEERRAYDARYRTKTGKSRAVRRRADYAANPEPHRARSRKYYEDNPEKCRAKSTVYHQSNPEKIRAIEQAYRLAHPEVAQENSKQRRARKKNAPVNDLSAAQWKEIKAAYNYRCVYCPPSCKMCQTKTHKLTQDHVTPYAHNGSHTLWNVVPACRSCNSSKQHRQPPKPVQPLLLTVAPARKPKAS